MDNESENVTRVKNMTQLARLGLETLLSSAFIFLLLQEPLLRRGHDGKDDDADAAAAWGKINTTGLKCILAREKDRPPESKTRRKRKKQDNPKVGIPI